LRERKERSAVRHNLERGVITGAGDGLVGRQRGLERSAAWVNCVDIDLGKLEVGIWRGMDVVMHFCGK
jgi:hypothetical protein